MQDHEGLETCISGTLRIGPYEPHNDELFDVVDRKQIGHLTVVRIKPKPGVMRTPTTMRTQPTLTIIHDGKWELGINGNDEDWAIPMARYCIDHPFRR